VAGVAVKTTSSVGSQNLNPALSLVSETERDSGFTIVTCCDFTAGAMPEAFAPDEHELDSSTLTVAVEPMLFDQPENTAEVSPSGSWTFVPDPSHCQT
jgi:hypothetical protein